MHLFGGWDDALSCNSNLFGFSPYFSSKVSKLLLLSSPLFVILGILFSFVFFELFILDTDMLSEEGAWGIEISEYEGAMAELFP